MSTPATQAPVIPPRPSRNQDKTNINMPAIPPRPAARRLDSSERFAPSPLNESPLHPKPRSLGAAALHGESIERSRSVDMPSLGEEGQEYATLADQVEHTNGNGISAEQTHAVADDLKLHAPKPSLPAMSAKQRVMMVTRTDSDRAASFGIGRPGNHDDTTAAAASSRSLKKKASTTSQLSHTSSHYDDEHGIPEIGQQVPMYKNAGDVQAPSPAPGSERLKPVARPAHSRRHSGNCPPGSYGLHGHGVLSQDKLEKAYYEKHPEELQKEHHHHHYDRPNDFSMSKDDLDKIVRQTASHGSGLRARPYSGTPSEQVGWQAIDESTNPSRVASPMKSDFPRSARGSSDGGRENVNVIHVDEPGHRKSFGAGDEDVNQSGDDSDRRYSAPILAEDEIAKDPSSVEHLPAVELPPERSGSAFEMDRPSRPTSRPSSRPGSLHAESSFDMRSTPLEDVKEFEPLFPEDDKLGATQNAPKPTHRREPSQQRFPSRDIWEDAPNSVHYTAEVSTPDVVEESSDEIPEGRNFAPIPPPRDGESPAHAFARHQEELAEKESREHISTRGGSKPQHPVWVQANPHLASELKSRPGMTHRFPSQDVWEDTPDSLKLETTVSGPQQEEVSSPVTSSDPWQEAQGAEPATPSETVAVAASEKEKPSIPHRPKPRQPSGDDKPTIPDRPKPQIPVRPAKAGPTSGGLEPAEAAAPPPKQKPAVPARPMGSKIAALQAGFMSDLNNRLRLGPQAPAPKKEEAEEEKQEEQTEKAPLSDARKGRARGPQRRAPAKSAAPPVVEGKPVLSFHVARTVFSIDPEYGVLAFGERKGEMPVVEEVEGGESKVVEKEATVSGPAVTAEHKAEETVAESPKAVEEETKSLATNMAGEPVMEETIKRDEQVESVEPVKVEEH